MLQLILVLILFHAFELNCTENYLKQKCLENTLYNMHKYPQSAIKAKP